MLRPVCAIIFLLGTNALGAETVTFDDSRWSLTADRAELVEYQGKQALLLHNGRAVLDEVDLRDGVVEFDIAFGAERGFSGAMFRFQRPGDFENVYFRPHQSGKPDASQYTPDINGVSGWQLFHGPQYAAPFKYRFDEWMPVRIEFSGDRAAISIDGQKLLISDLRRTDASGAIGLRSGFAPAYYSNFRYEAAVPTEFASQEFVAVPANETEGLVRLWRVSSAVPADQRPSLQFESLPESLEWQQLQVEPEGFVNLAVAKGVDAENRSVFAQFDLQSEAPSTRLMQFGYSDLVRVFLNGTEVYRGSNGYRSRDFRYLGTIGLFDVVPLPLQAGKNTVTFVVSESFGGWGVMAVVPNTN